jgi:DUF4097 and DUF4098 domain-containing protein YvlB
MLRSGLFSALGVALVFGPHTATGGDAVLRQEGSRWVQTLSGTQAVPAGARLRISGQGPVTVVAEPSADAALSYSVDISVKARDEAHARRILSGYTVRAVDRSGVFVLELPRGPAISTMMVRAPRGLREAVVTTSDGNLNVSGIEAPLRADTGGGRIQVDRLGGDCKLVTGGGEIKIGTAAGGVTAVTGGGPITVHSIHGEAMLQTGGGDILADEIAGPVRASTMAGTVRIRNAGAAVVATTGGGAIIVDHAQGLVTARNAAGPVQVGGASGVRCEAGTGAIKLNNVSGSMRVTTAMGSIIASLLAGQLAESFLSTGNGDITVVFPSNLGVTIRAENEMADTMQRIVSEFPAIPVRLRGTQVVAEGAINGGGPLLRISGTGGTIFIKRQ